MVLNRKGVLRGQITGPIRGSGRLSMVGKLWEVASEKDGTIGESFSEIGWRLGQKDVSGLKNSTTRKVKREDALRKRLGEISAGNVGKLGDKSPVRSA